MEDTICAISTAVGVGGISIIRLSGDNAIKIVSSIFKGKDLSKVESHTINYGKIVFKNEIIDEVLVSIMKKPKTYTMEDVVEINLHGGIAVTNKMLEILLELGCRQAEPGEFTKRAFLNGRIDLIEAESVIDCINAESDNARKLSINGINGNISNIIRDIKKDILKVETQIEVKIDYPEYEDIEEVSYDEIINLIHKIKTKIDFLSNESKNGIFIKDGINIAIVGKPNVGKSSILNRLLGSEKAIVTDIKGTTRDIVEGKIILNGITINLVDTAGIRDTDDIVEKIGVNKSIEMIKKADLVLFVISSIDFNDEDIKIYEDIKKYNHIIYINKSDICNLDVPFKENVVYGTTVELNGLEELKNKIIDVLKIGDIQTKDMTYLSNARQLDLIKKASSSINEAYKNTCDKMPIDIIEVDITSARNYLNEILGEVYKDEMIDELFNRFCIGK